VHAELSELSPRPCEDFFRLLKAKHLPRHAAAGVINHADQVRPAWGSAMVSAAV
jgi:hypothetical protein